MMNLPLTLEALREQTPDWEAEWAGWVAELGSYVKRAEARDRLGAYLRGLLGALARRNSWQLSEHQGEAHPYGFQHLLHRARWDEDGIRDAVRRRVYETLYDEDGVLILDETGFIKESTRRELNASTAGRRGESRTVRSVSFWATPVAGGRACWIGACLSLRTGPRIGSVAAGRVSPMWWSISPRRNSLGRCWSRPWTAG